MAIVSTAEAITVPDDADDAALEKYRLLIEERLNWVHERAYAIIDKKIKIPNKTPGTSAGKDRGGRG